MKTTQYTSIEKKIARNEKGSIRDRWQYGLRLLHDPEATTDRGKSLKNGVTEQLIKIATHRGLKLSAQEIRRRVQCARAYPTESQFGHAMTEFTTWFDLIQAGFPPFPVDPIDDKPADHRTRAERKRDLARAVLDAVGMQEALFPLDQFEPTETPLKDLIAYNDDQHHITDGFVAVGERRDKYLDELLAAVGHNLDRSWADAHKAAFGTDDVEEDNPPTVVEIDTYPLPVVFNDDPPVD